MNSSDSQPKLPTWIFILTDVVLIGAAALIGATSPRPFSAEAMFWMVACIIIGAVVGLVPIIVHFERQKNETLDDRQRALESLSRTIHASAEQIGIATNGLHEITELAQKNLKHAEQLPHKLQDKIAEFQAQLNNVGDTEKEELERELLALRTSESERLDTVSQRIAKSAADWTKLEAATQQHLTAATEALSKLSLGTASAIGKAQAAAEQALAQARTEAARTLGETSGQATRAIEAAKVAALAEIDAKFTAAANAAVERVTAKIAAVTQAQPIGEKAAPTELSSAAPAPPQPAAATTATAAKEESSTAPAIEPVAEAAPAPAKRPRKPRREETVAPAEAKQETSDAPPTETQTGAVAEKNGAPRLITTVVEPPPIPVERIVEVAPIAPHTADPFTERITASEVPARETASVASPASPETADLPAASPATPRKRTKKSEAAPAPSAEPEASQEPDLGLQLDSSNSALGSGVGDRVLSSDGATRLLVTAYIGIGNRIFIRGSGPGLSWDKGLPLQFVSIGKWRWETNDAVSRVQFKLYKNDDVECAALGAQTLDPGHQQELTATF
jgi:hypothetical protein